MFPLLALDVWEHAFYVDYENRKADYLGGIWNIVNWQVVQDRLERYRNSELNTAGSTKLIGDVTL